ncbi:MAG: hypothetical protein EOM88_02805 [Clostridia bacterium]|nr:hypothetical protein [Clostridia bacterium]
MKNEKYNLKIGKRPEDFYQNVLVRIPNFKDIHMTWVPEHYMSIEGNETLIRGHYRRGHQFGYNNFVTINYYEIGEKIGEMIVADIRLIYGKTKKPGTKRLILDIYPAKAGELPKYRLKVGSPIGEARHLIPGTKDKYIRFQLI